MISIIDVVDDVVESVYELTSIDRESLPAVPVKYDDDDIDDYDEVVVALTGMHFCPKAQAKLEINLKHLEMPLVKPSIISPLTLELNELPSYLKYVFLGDNCILSVIFVVDLLK